MQLACRYTWQRIEVSQIEDLSGVVRGAELEAIQLAGARVHGSVSFVEQDGISLTNCTINSGLVSLRGLLSRRSPILFVGLKFGSGSRQWLSAVEDGDVGIIMPGDEFDAIHSTGTHLVTIAVSRERLDLSLDRHGSGFPESTYPQTGLHSAPIPEKRRLWLKRRLEQSVLSTCDDGVGHEVLHAIVDHYQCTPTMGDGRTRPVGRAQIVDRVRAYIGRNISSPISIADLTEAGQTSPRSLHRAFVEVLGESPLSFVRRVRLHAIRRELCGNATSDTISSIVNSFGKNSDPGRLAGRYRNLFGETPAVTRAKKHVGLP
ncbi:helix-turn-helix domain-containing protein [Mesorhizobium marinum]|uniref:helix-turn-helix domain-containing protein n=1 Tax=Mesorhizobium marinum TaxID=3228790 RepID=UPI0034664854